MHAHLECCFATLGSDGLTHEHAPAPMQTWDVRIPSTASRKCLREGGPQSPSSPKGFQALFPAVDEDPAPDLRQVLPLRPKAQYALTKHSDLMILKLRM